MILLFYSTGIRLSELLNIRLIDVDIERGLLKIKGKFKKERIVPLGKMAQRYIESYIEKVRPAQKSEVRKKLFTSSVDGKTYTKKYAKKYAVTGGIQEKYRL